MELLFWAMAERPGAAAAAAVAPAPAPVAPAAAPAADNAAVDAAAADGGDGGANEQPNVAVGPEWREQNQGEAEEANWNPMEWDRPAEELTWERLLGLDGSLLFLEHVFWVMSLNTLFIMVRILGLFDWVFFIHRFTKCDTTQYKSILVEILISVLKTLSINNKHCIKKKKS